MKCSLCHRPADECLRAAREYWHGSLKSGLVFVEKGWICWTCAAAATALFAKLWRQTYEEKEPA